MEYERIHSKAQMGVMSPTKLRMKLMGCSHGGGKKDEAAAAAQGRSPSRLAAAGDDDDHPRNSLLAHELDEEYPKDWSDSSRSRSGGSHGRAAGNGYDSGNGGGGGNFEFCGEERVARPFFRQVPSKWNDAEKWIAGRHVVHSNPIFFSSKSAAAQGQNGGGGVRVAPESVAPSPDEKKSGGGGGGGVCTYSLASRSAAVCSAVTELSPSSVDGPTSNKQQQPPRHHKKLAPAAVSMRDIGTEMTPMASQEQSRSGTPGGGATPSLSPVPASPSASQRELHARTRREIAALGLQLGKLSIASWASKEDFIVGIPSPVKSSAAAAVKDEAKKAEFEARAVAWAESQKCKLESKYQKKEMKIQKWEMSQKSKFEAKMRHAEVKAERTKNSLSKRLSTLSHKVEGKQARVEARRNRRTIRLARQVDRICKTGRVPSRFWCCGSSAENSGCLWMKKPEGVNAIKFVYEIITGFI